MSKHTDLMNSLNNAIAYSWVLGWYAGRDGKTTDSGKIQATEDIKAKHPDIVRVIESQPELLEACKLLLEANQQARDLSLNRDEPHRGMIWGEARSLLDAAKLKANIIVAKATE